MSWHRTADGAVVAAHVTYPEGCELKPRRELGFFASFFSPTDVSLNKSLI